MTPRLALLAGCLLLAVRPLHAAAAQPKGEKYAFLVGCGQYDARGIPTLEHTVDDVTDFATVLRETGWPDGHIVLMHDGRPDRFLPQCKKIRKELTLQLSGARPEDFVVVALSGHGLKFKGDDHGYFCPADADPKDRDSLLSLAEVYDRMAQCKAGRKLLLINACRSDPREGFDLKGLETFLTWTKAEEVPSGVAALFSCSAGQVSWEDGRLGHGVFFHYVLQGWQGDAHPEGPVTLDDLVRYVTRETETYAQAKVGTDQAPVFKGDACGGWVLAEGGATAEAEDKAVEAVERLHGTVTRDDKRPGRPVVEVHLSFSQAADADLKELAAMRRLQVLVLSFTPVTDAGLKNLAALKNLQKLYLNDTKVTDAGLKDLVELKGLQRLYLGDTGVTDAGLKDLAELKGLQSVKLHSTKVTGAGVKELQTALPRIDVDY